MVPVPNLTKISDSDEGLHRLQGYKWVCIGCSLNKQINKKFKSLSNNASDRASQMIGHYEMYNTSRDFAPLNAKLHVSAAL